MKRKILLAFAVAMSLGVASFIDAANTFKNDTDYRVSIRKIGFKPGNLKPIAPKWQGAISFSEYGMLIQSIEVEGKKIEGDRILYQF